MPVGEKKFRLAVFCVLGLFGGANCALTTTKLGPQPIWNSTFTDKLRRDLLLNYDKFARPAQHDSTTKVQFDLCIKHIELNEFKSSMIVHSWFKVTWTDEKLNWDPKNYGDLDSVNLADHELWQPDIFIYNSATSQPISHYNTHCRVGHEGNVLWVPPTQFTVLCDLNLKYWPFDSQKCELQFGSWTYHGEQIDVSAFDNKTSLTLDLLIENNEWLIYNSKVERQEVIYENYTYPKICIQLFLKRISPSYKAIILTPAIVVIILTLLCFWLPPNSGEKLIINACTAIVICLFMLYFTQKIPAMGNHTPLIVLFYSSCLYIVTFSMIGSVVVIAISRSKHTNTLPWVIKQPLTGRFGKYLGLSPYMPHQSAIAIHKINNAAELKDHHVTDFDDTMSIGDEHGIVGRSHTQINLKPSVQDDWILLAAAIDRISFSFYCLLFAILSIVYSV